MININNKIKIKLKRKNIKETVGTLEKAGQNLLQIEAPKSNLKKSVVMKKIIPKLTEKMVKTASMSVAIQSRVNTINKYANHG